MSTWQPTPTQRRLDAAWMLADITRALLGPTEYEELSDETVELLSRLTSVLMGVLDACGDRDDRAVWAAQGTPEQAPDRCPDISVADAELIVEVAERMFTGAFRRRSAEQRAERERAAGRPAA
ncbi:hypothetical protein [Parafrankia discariae]|uniref:hypothetical protein n=1 Tax=Parafrankia discariae TaxID=365528 RepID=UPI000374C5AB|nr:hypothetical protein [Parafrankia discariae]